MTGPLPTCEMHYLERTARSATGISLFLMVPHAAHVDNRCKLSYLISYCKIKWLALVKAFRTANLTFNKAIPFS
jgi:hypothetical protein